MSDSRGGEVNSMQTEDQSRAVGRMLVTVAAFVVVTAGMRAAAEILQPFLLAIFLAVILAPLFHSLQRHHVPTILAMLVVITAPAILGAMLALLLATNLTEFLGDLPVYEEVLRQEGVRLVDQLDHLGFNFPEEEFVGLFNPGTAMSLVGALLASLSLVLSNAFLILITVVFILLEVATLDDKLRRILPHPEASIPRVHAILQNLKRYTAIKSLISMATGVLVGVSMWAIGLNYPVLWGITAFLFNFVPNIGSIIAAVPAVLLAFVQLGPASAAVVVGIYAAINGVIGNLIEPRYMGRGLGLSTLVVFLSMVFWGWILGPTGMLLSVPLTMTLKIILEGFDDTRWVAVLLGAAVEEELPAET